MKRRERIFKMIWWIYILLLFLVVIIKFRGSFMELWNNIFSGTNGTNYNIVPFRTIGVQLEHVSEWWALRNLLGNIIPFMPFGFLLPVVFPKVKSAFKVLISGFTFIVFAEVFQFITRLGSFDVDDIILNMLGVCLGYLLYFIKAGVMKK